MTDRQPGAPGQYVMTVSAAEVQNLLTGNPVTVILVRDDQPAVEGTPYNKASVLPDKLAEKICPSVPDPTPADAFAGLLGSSSQITLLAAAWTNRQQKIPVSGVTDKNNVIVAPAPVGDNDAEYSSCGVRCIAQSAGFLTFECTYAPSVDLIVNVNARA